jgi:hypothetical protein
VSAAAARPDGRGAAGARSPLGTDREHRQLLLERLPVTGRTLERRRFSDEELEVVVAVLTAVLEQRHGLRIPQA